MDKIVFFDGGSTDAVRNPDGSWTVTKRRPGRPLVTETLPPDNILEELLVKPFPGIVDPPERK